MPTERDQWSPPPLAVPCGPATSPFQLRSVVLSAKIKRIHSRRQDRMFWAVGYLPLAHRGGTRAARSAPQHGWAIWVKIIGRFQSAVACRLFHRYPPCGTIQSTCPRQIRSVLVGYYTPLAVPIRSRTNTSGPSPTPLLVRPPQRGPRRDAFIISLPGSYFKRSSFVRAGVGLDTTLHSFLRPNSFVLH